MREMGKWDYVMVASATAEGDKEEKNIERKINVIENKM